MYDIEYLNQLKIERQILEETIKQDQHELHLKNKRIDDIAKQIYLKEDNKVYALNLEFVTYPHITPKEVEEFFRRILEESGFGCEAMVVKEIQ